MQKAISNFFQKLNIEISCQGPKYRSEMFRDRMSTPETYFQSTCIKGKSQKMKTGSCILF